MPLNKLDNFIKNTEGRILYVSPSDLDSSDSIDNTGNSLARPFKTIQRAILESARFSYVKGNSNDLIERTTILLMPGEHIVDNRPGFYIKDVGGTATVVSRSGANSAAANTLDLNLNSNFDLSGSLINLNVGSFKSYTKIVKSQTMDNVNNIIRLSYDPVALWKEKHHFRSPHR